MKIAWQAAAALALAFAHALGQDATMGAKDPSGADVRLDQQMAARDQTAEIVARLLRRPLTVASAVQLAVLNNQGLQAAFGGIGIAQADVIEAVTIPNPAVDFDVEFPASDSSLNRYGWLVAQDFIQILMAPLKKKIAMSQLEIVRLRLADQVLDLIAEVKTAFFTCQADQQVLARLKVIQETNAAGLDLAQKQYAAGNTTEFSLLEAQGNYSQGRLDIANAEMDLRGQREKLNRLLGLWGADTEWQIKGDLMPVPEAGFSVEKLESLAVSQRLDLRAAYRELISTVSSLGLTKTYRWLPVLKMGFAGERDIDGALNLGPSVSFELPIFNQGQSRVARGEAELRIAESRLEALAIDIRSQVREYRDKLLSLREAAKFYQTELLPTRIRMVNQALLESNAMAVSQYSLFETKSREVETERGYIETLRDYWITRAELERAVGGTLTPQPARASTPAKEPIVNSK